MVCGIFNPSATEQPEISRRTREILKITILDLKLAVKANEDPNQYCDPQFYRDYLDGTGCDMTSGEVSSQASRCYNVIFSITSDQEMSGDTFGGSDYDPNFV